MRRMVICARLGDCHFVVRRAIVAQLPAGQTSKVPRGCWRSGSCTRARRARDRTRMDVLARSGVNGRTQGCPARVCELTLGAHHGLRRNQEPASALPFVPLVFNRQELLDGSLPAYLVAEEHAATLVRKRLLAVRRNGGGQAVRQYDRQARGSLGQP